LNLLRQQRRLHQQQQRKYCWCQLLLLTLFDNRQPRRHRPPQYLMWLNLCRHHRHQQQPEKLPSKA
jgi:hypothetical protein